jgi:uncharacterized protein YndB with AHSA1/START domain
MAEANDLVLERTFDVPRDLVWKALTSAEHLKQWFAPKPYEIVECTLELTPGGEFSFRMNGPDDFDQKELSCVLDVVEGEKVAWTNALLPRFRPAPAMPEGCGGFPMTAIMTLEDLGGGRTRYRATALHRNAADRDMHEQMGFHEGWGTCADQLGELAASLAEKV